MRRINLIAALLLLIVLGGCSTKKNTWTSRQYHNLTARFNVHFNANQSFKEASKKAEGIYPQSFDEILPVFAFAYSEAPNVTMSDLDRTVTKSEKLIAKHSITAKPKRKASPSESYRKFYNRKEFNNMVDDAYLFIGKSQLFSQKYEEAKATFENIISTYPDQNSVTEARIWLVVLAAQTESPQEAEAQLKKLEERLKKDDEIVYSKKLRLAISSAWADIYIKQEEYNQAIHKLEDALSIARMRETKVRYRFILAQLYERIGNKSMATTYYEKIAKMNVPYDVQFSALMSIANTMDSQTQGKELETRYKKMLANENNTEYFDQIYYALGNLAKTQGDTTSAIGYYKKSVEASMGNDIQKGLSSLALGNHYYSVQDFYPAYTGYYDASELLTNHPKQKYADSMAHMLNAVGKNLAVVNREDSLQLIAKMDPTERQAYADAQAKKALELQQAEQQQYQYSSGYGYQHNQQQVPGMRAQSTSTSNRWYFYNITTTSQGANDFKARWGRRKLEDNWRRKNKAISAIEEESIDDELLAEGETPDVSTPKKDIPTTSAEYYLQDVPLTEEAMEASNARLERALYNLASAYYSDIHNNAKALETYLRLLRDFPQNDNLPAIYYSIYQLLMAEGRYTEAEDYKARLINEFPENRMALVAQNPNYLDELIVLERQAEQKYEEALTFYRSGDHAQALSIANGSLQTYKGLTVEPNFALLKVLSTAYNNNINSYKEDLQSVAKSYPNTSASAAARSILSTLENGVSSPSSESPKLPSPPKTTEEEVTIEETPTPPAMEEVTADQDYRYTENAEHLILIVVNKDMAINQLAFNIALFNADRYLNQNYQLREEPNIDSNSKAIVISSFAGKTEAMGYYNAIIGNPKTLSIEGESILCFVISKDNLERLKLKKALGDYTAFFRQHYDSKGAANISVEKPTTEPEEETAENTEE